MTTKDYGSLRFPDAPSGAKKKLWLVTYSPGGERALVGSTSRAGAASLSDEIARRQRIKRTGADIATASQADVDVGGFIEIVA